MKKNQNDTPKEEYKRPEGERGVVSRSITQEMRDSYLDYAMSVITARALPDVRDGLKPVHRRILFSMHEKGLTATAKFRKSATVVGDVLGNYHPHGDAAVYDSMVKMAQPFSFRYPLVLGQGNFGSIDGDPPAAYRYTEAKMSRLSAEILRDIEKETVDWKPNFDATKREPSLMPTAVPNLLLNGTLGIAVGMATNIPPHNLTEVIDATQHLIDNDDASTEDLLQFIKGPDFPTGGIAFSANDIKHASSTGKGGVVVRGEAEIIETKSGSFQIVITSIPYRVNKSDLIENIANHVRDKKLEGIKEMRDESTSDIRVVIELKGSANPQAVLNYLYKHTQLEETFHYNLVALVHGVPQTLSIKTVLQEFITHREIVVRRRTEFDLRKAEEREHILLGLKKALDHIDAIIKLIRASKDVPAAHAALMKEFKFSERQATAILEMRLQKLAGLERKKIEEELAEVQALIRALKELLSSNKKIRQVISKELAEIKEKFGDERRTKIIKGEAKQLSLEDLVPDQETILVLTSGGYVKRTAPEEYRKQKRGGVGVVDLDTKEEDFVTHFLTASTHNDVLFFTNRGKAYQIKMYEFPEGRRATKGKSIMNYISLEQGEKVTSVLAMPKELKKSDLSLMLITKNGTGKKTEAEAFHDVRRNGIIAIKLVSGDELISAVFVEKGDTVSVVTEGGQSIRFDEDDIREMGRAAAGVRAMSVDKDDAVIAADVIKKDAKNVEILVVTQNGYGKKTAAKEYKVQGRGGSGIKTADVTSKTGKIINAKVISDPDAELVAMSKKSQVIRVDSTEIPSLGRQTQGVRIMKLRDGDALAAAVVL
ncbi:MAG TPA: DNA gyrase subunit A [Candidatus Paceibacterota bacterium]|nr:DNA gyrase subunit A [Candidatus Paceibacterota bacterium]